MQHIQDLYKTLKAPLRNNAGLVFGSSQERHLFVASHDNLGWRTHGVSTRVALGRSQMPFFLEQSPIMSGEKKAYYTERKRHVIQHSEFYVKNGFECF